MLVEILCGFALCTSVFSVVEVGACAGKNLTTEGTKFHRGKNTEE
jgi:hypothetical protein